MNRRQSPLQLILSEKPNFSVYVHDQDRSYLHNFIISSISSLRVLKQETVYEDILQIKKKKLTSFNIP